MSRSFSEDLRLKPTPHSTGYCNTCCLKRPRGKLCSSCDRTPGGGYDLQAYDRGSPQAHPPLASGRTWTARACSALGASGEQRAASAGSFPATQAAGVTVQSRRTSRRKGGLCGRGRVGSRMRFGQLSSCGSKRVGLQRSSVDAPSWRDAQWCARSRSTSISIATPRPAATCGPAFLAPGASAAGAARAKQGGGGGRFRTSV